MSDVIIHKPGTNAFTAGCTSLANWNHRGVRGDNALLLATVILGLIAAITTGVLTGEIFAGVFTLLAIPFSWMPLVAWGHLNRQHITTPELYERPTRTDPTTTAALYSCEQRINATHELLTRARHAAAHITHHSAEHSTAAAEELAWHTAVRYQAAHRHVGPAQLTQNTTLPAAYTEHRTAADRLYRELETLTEQLETTRAAADTLTHHTTPDAATIGELAAVAHAELATEELAALAAAHTELDGAAKQIQQHTRTATS